MLTQRVRQQELLSQLGVTALQGASFDHLLQHTVELAAEGLGAEFCKVMEYLPAEKRLLVRAGKGWKPGVVGVATIGTDLDSPAGYAMRTGKPVISNHLENEHRFRTPDILSQHGVRRAMNVILEGDGRPFGVLEVDSRSEDGFVEQDIAFLQGAANILGMAIERQRREVDLKNALERYQTLLKEMNHRVKNSLAMVSSLLRLQCAEIEEAAVRQQLDEAVHRVSALARAHENLYQSDDVERLDIGLYVSQICRDMREALAPLTIHVEAEAGVEIATDRAIPIGLIAVELITNAAKYAYPGDATGGEIWVRLVGTDASGLVLSVRDRGAGLPAGFDMATAKSLGMRVIAAFAGQLQAKITVSARNPGAEFVVSLRKHA